MSKLAKDYSGSRTYRKVGCQGCCRYANDDNKHVGLAGNESSSCSECGMDCHTPGCPEDD